MNFLSKIFGTNKTSNTAEKLTPSTQPQGDTKCPYCKAPLKKKPGAKTKCSSCGNYMYVRTRPSDNQRVVVTKQQADDIEEEWIIVSGTHDQYLEQKKEYQNEREKLQERFGQEPSDHDVKWGLLNKELIEHARKGDWGLYRNTRLTMGDILRKEMRLKPALEIYLEVCYIDLNGPNNTGGIRDAQLLREYPPFRPKEGMVFPGMIDYLQRVSKKLNLLVEDVEKMYVEHNQRVYNSLRLPVSPEKSWPKLQQSLTL